MKLSVMPPMRAMLGTAVQLNHIAEMPVIEYGTWEPVALDDGAQARRSTWSCRRSGSWCWRR